MADDEITIQHMPTKEFQAHLETLTQWAINSGLSVETRLPLSFTFRH
jgi:hypothetical protein